MTDSFSSPIKYFSITILLLSRKGFTGFWQKDLKKKYFMTRLLVSWEGFEWIFRKREIFAVKKMVLCGLMEIKVVVDGFEIFLWKKLISTLFSRNFGFLISDYSFHNTLHKKLNLNFTLIIICQLFTFHSKRKQEIAHYHNNCFKNSVCYLKTWLTFPFFIPLIVIK